jgi:hypothetical protein
MMLMKDAEIKLIGPPTLVGRCLSTQLRVGSLHNRALAGGTAVVCIHNDLRLMW